jgi:hypothetical protein
MNTVNIDTVNHYWEAVFSQTGLLIALGVVVLIFVIIITPELIQHNLFYMGAPKTVSLVLMALASLVMCMVLLIRGDFIDNDINKKNTMDNITASLNSTYQVNVSEGDVEILGYYGQYFQSRKDASIAQWDDMNQIPSYAPLGTTTLAVNGEPVEAQLWLVEGEYRLMDASTGEEFSQMKELPVRTSR